MISQLLREPVVKEVARVKALSAAGDHVNAERLGEYYWRRDDYIHNHTNFRVPVASC